MYFVLLVNYPSLLTESKQTYTNCGVWVVSNMCGFSERPVE